MATIKVGSDPWGIAITPDGKTAYVANDVSSGATVTVIDIQTNQVLGSPIAVVNDPVGIAITPDGKTAYVANNGAESVSVINTQTNQVVGTPITVGVDPFMVAIPPNQPPVASFVYLTARPGVPVTFDASASSDPDGMIASYDWAFGDGLQGTSASPSVSHTYHAPGIYKATLTATDNEGCSTAFVFTGQTAFCNGSAAASASQIVKVAYPGVRLGCPKRAKHGGCKFKLQAVSRKRKGKAESAVAGLKLRAGRSAIVSLKPRAAYRAKLATAKKVLVEETATIDGSKRTRVVKLKIVQ